MINLDIPEQLATAIRSYLHAFGHPVPDEIIERYATRCGPLLLEIRQAIALQQPVKSWLGRSRSGSVGVDAMPRQ